MINKSSKSNSDFRSSFFLMPIRRICLVRIQERDDGSLSIESKPDATTDDDYLAISHVWGDPSTIEKVYVDGAGLVELSPGKRDILSILRRDAICGKDWFWMDLFCMSQSATSPISISEQLQAIPQIYKSSRVTKVLIESPICREWPKTAYRARFGQFFEVDIFHEEEARHSRKCPHILFFDPWFERLWTRQEGLYGMHLEVVVLNWIDCKRHTVHLSDMARWKTEGEATLRQQYALQFIRDKLSYHDLGQENEFASYFNLFYNHHLRVSEFGGGVGPSGKYLPFTAAWRSARRTTKERDYVLAVMPDVEGYTVPPNAREYSFKWLFANAFDQFRNSLNLSLISKVPRGMMEIGTTGSGMPWITTAPFDITEAYDTFLVMPSVKQDDLYEKGRRVKVVDRCAELERVDFSRDKFEELLDLWGSTGSFEYQISSLPLNGPCVGYSRDFQTMEELLFREFGHAFIKPVVDHQWNLKASGVVNLNSLDVSDEVFSHALKLFLICFICGTTLPTAREIHEQTEFRLFPSRFGKLIGLIKKDVLATLRDCDLRLVTTGWSLSQGLQVSIVKERTQCHIVGKTQVPKGIEGSDGITSGGEILEIEVE